MTVDKLAPLPMSYFFFPPQYYRKRSFWMAYSNLKIIQPVHIGFALSYVWFMIVLSLTLARRGIHFHSLASLRFNVISCPRWFFFSCHIVAGNKNVWLYTGHVRLILNFKSRILATIKSNFSLTMSMSFIENYCLIRQIKSVCFSHSNRIWKV